MEHKQSICDAGDIVNLTHTQEANRQILSSMLRSEESKLQEGISKRYGVDILDKDTFDFTNPMFSWKKLEEASVRLAERLREAEAVGVHQALLRAGINMIANTWYETVDTPYEKICATTVSNKFMELYAPMHIGAIPRRVERGAKFPQGKLVGMDIQLRNETFGLIMSLERVLFEDDQTGQIQQRAMDAGKNMRILENAWFATKFIGAASSYAGDPIPASETKPSDEANWPWSDAMVGGGKNKLAGYAAFSSPNLQALDIILMNQLDKNGNKLLVTPDTLYIGTDVKFAAATLLNSEWYPATTSMKVSGTGADTGVGITFAKNVMEGLYNLIVDRFLPKKAYSIGQAGKGSIFQRRTALEMTQENPQSGLSFDQDEYRFRARSRWNTDWIDPRFWALGNDGTV